MLCTTVFLFNLLCLGKQREIEICSGIWMSNRMEMDPIPIGLQMPSKKVLWGSLGVFRRVPSSAGIWSPGKSFSNGLEVIGSRLTIGSLS